jgi:hypothetical protein
MSVGGRCGWAPSRASCAGAVVLEAILWPPPFSCRAVAPPSPCPFPRPRLALADVYVVLAKGMRLRRVRKTSALSLRFKETQRLLKHRHTRSRDGCTIAFTFIQSSSYPSSIFPLHIAPSTSPSCDTGQSFSTDHISVSEPTATACVQVRLRFLFCVLFSLGFPLILLPS